MGIDDQDKKYMRRCLQLAANGLGRTYPNPMVGSVIVHDGRIIGEGFHSRAGEPHAEINAINAVKNKDLLKFSTLYVNLEPCAHYGKTPPCAHRIANEYIPRVVIGTLDPNAQVAGKGVEIMEDAGIQVENGILEPDSRLLNRRFFASHLYKRPFIILKWAQTLDGYIDIVRRPDAPVKPNWITNEISRINVHKWRTEEEAIMVGTKTAQKDNPRLNVRNWSGKDPLRVILDENLKLEKQLALMDESIPTRIYNGRIHEKHGNLNYRRIDFNKGYAYVLHELLHDLYAHGIQTLFVEGGSVLINSFVNADLWDEGRMFIGNTFFREGVNAPVLRNEKLLREEHFGHSKLFVFKNINREW